MQLQKLLPFWDIKNIRIFYILAILSNAWFVLPNWMFLYGQYLTKQQIGLVEAIAIILGVLIEVPTGIISDIFGKKKTLIIGNVAIALSAYVVTQAHSFPLFLIGNCLTFIGFAFNSGSFEAFAYDSMVEQNSHHKYDVVVAKSTSLGLIFSFISIFIGGFLFSIHPTLPFAAWAATSILSSVILLFAHEPKFDTEHMSYSLYLTKLRDGVMTIFSKRFSDVLIPVVFLAIINKLNQGVVRQSFASHFGFNGITFSFILGFSMLIAFFSASKFDNIKIRFGSYKILLFVLIGYMSVFIFGASFSTTWIGLIYFFSYMIIDKLGYQINTVVSNERIDSKHRATALSVIALISQMPYVMLMFFFADWTNSANISGLFYGFAGVMAFVFCFMVVIFKKRAHI